MKLSSML